MTRSAPRSRWFSIPPAGLVLLLLAGCDIAGLETPGMAKERKETEGKAIGAACRHAVRSIEECHMANPRVSKSSIYDGWREMDGYMRDNEIQGMPGPPLPPPPQAEPTPEGTEANPDGAPKEGEESAKEEVVLTPNPPSTNAAVPSASAPGTAAPAATPAAPARGPAAPAAARPAATPPPATR